MNNNILGRNIRKARLKKGWTQKQLAEAIGVKHNSISDWENGKSKPYADTLELIMGVLGVDANTLLGWDDPERIKEDAEELADKISSDEIYLELMRLLGSDGDMQNEAEILVPAETKMEIVEINDGRKDVGYIEVILKEVK